MSDEPAAAYNESVTKGNFERIIAYLGRQCIGGKAAETLEAFDVTKLTGTEG